MLKLNYDQASYVWDDRPKEFDGMMMVVLGEKNMGTREDKVEFVTKIAEAVKRDEVYRILFNPDALRAHALFAGALAAFRMETGADVKEAASEMLCAVASGMKN
jgi:hypothetical protein